jgi:dienelactone hydrolase
MRNPARIPALAAAVLWAALSSSPAAAGDAALAKAEKGQLAKAAAEWVELGKWCLSKKLAGEAKQCAERAEKLDAGAPGLKDLQEKAGSCEDAATDADKKAWEKKLETSADKVAGILEKIFSMGASAPDASDQARCEGWLWAALELSPTEKRWKAVAGAIVKLAAGKEEGKGTRLAARALGLKPPEKVVPALRALLEEGARKGLVLMTASSHPLCYYFSLPKKFQRAKDRKWPVLLCVDGAGSNFEGMGRGYVDNRGDLPYMVVSPCTFSNTNKIEGGMADKYRKYYTQETIDDGNKRRIDWDEEGVLAAIEDLTANFDAESRVYVTGFSGGGNVTYMMIFKHPDLVAGAAPACANFGRPDYEQLKGSFPAKHLDFPVAIFTGEKDEHRDFTFGRKDSPGIEPQTDWAMKVFEAIGYPNVKRTMVPGMQHSSAVQQVLEALGPYMLGKKMRTEKLG